MFSVCIHQASLKTLFVVLFESNVTSDWVTVLFIESEVVLLFSNVSKYSIIWRTRLKGFKRMVGE